MSFLFLDVFNLQSLNAAEILPDSICNKKTAVEKIAVFFDAKWF